MYIGVSARLPVYRRERHLGPCLPERRHTDTLLGYGCMSIWACAYVYIVCICIVYIECTCMV